ncbi:hypothetical protein FACS1894102_0260 [Spirochaetia bacterium]|nr:hypothetical protein FACS1894102_0260 [Spirochaetia bacterium]
MNASRSVLVAVIDGLGGGIGVQLVSKLREALSANAGVQILALGTNAVATERMIKAGANAGASGENAIVQSVAKATFILGPIGIIIGNSMMGEISQNISNAVLAASGERIVLPIINDHLTFAGIDGLPLARMIDAAVDIVKKRLE